MDNIFELNTVNNVEDEVGASKAKSTSPVVEVFSALVQGKSLSSFDGKVVDKSVEHIKDLAGRAIDGDHQTVPELNTIRRFTTEPRLIETIKVSSFIGTYKSVPYDAVPMMKTYKYESIDPRFQASSGDVLSATHSFREYPIGTQTISSGYAVDYRELQSGNFDGTIAKGISQMQIDMQNKAVYYAVVKLYDALKNTRGVKHFAENSGVTQTAVDEMLKKMHRYGRVNICGGYSVVSQFNDFAGYKIFGANTILFGVDAVAEEIRKTGLLSFYNGSHIVELPNALNFTRMNADRTSYGLYMPRGLLLFIPQGRVAPLQIFRRGGMTTMTGDDIVTRRHLARFDMEIGVGVAEGMEGQIGFLSGTNFEVPSL